MDETDVDEHRGDQPPILMLLDYQVVLFRSESNQHRRVYRRDRYASREAHEHIDPDVGADEDKREGIGTSEKGPQEVVLSGCFVLGDVGLE
jgi:hypothetical protein